MDTQYFRSLANIAQPTYIIHSMMRFTQISWDLLKQLSAPYVQKDRDNPASVGS